MIVRERPSFVRLFFILRGSIIQRIFPQLALVMALTAAIVWAHAVKPGLVPAFDGAPFALIGIALSIFLGFRNNACYDRWWEARKHWGHLVSVSRDLARRSLLIEARRPSGQAARARLLRLAIGFAHALVEHVRPSTATTAQGGTALAYLPEPERAGFGTSRNPPDFILRLIGRELAALRADDTLSDIEFGLFDAGLDQMAGVLAACERLRTTPIPFGYTLLLHRTAYLFCFLLPLGFADVLGWGTPGHDRARRLHVLRPRCARRRARRAVRHAAQRPADPRHRDDDRDQSARGAGRDRPAGAAAARSITCCSEDRFCGAGQTASGFRQWRVGCPAPPDRPPSTF